MKRFPPLLYRLLLLLSGLLLPVAAHALNLSVEIKGLQGEVADNARAFLSIEQEKSRAGLSVSRLRLLHKKAPQEIRKALQPFGYFKPQITADLQEDGQTFRAVYEVAVGPQIRLSAVDIQILGEAGEDPSFHVDFPLAVGDVLNQAVYEKAKQALLAKAIENGYLDVSYRLHQVLVDMQTYQAQIKLHLDTGRHFRFGEVRFVQDVMNPQFLARYLRFQPGDPFSHEKLLNLQSDLIDSEYFSQVEVLTLRDQAEGDQVPIDVICTPNKRDRYRIGLGYSTDTGPRITLDWKRRRFGPNGHRLGSELRLSKPHSTFKTEYLIPLERPSKDSLSFGFSLDRFDTDSRKGTLALVNAKHSVELENGWRRALGLDYSYENYDVADQQDKAFLLVPNVQWTRLKTDGKSFIQRGKRLDLRIEGAHDRLLSSTSYLQMVTHDKYIYGFGGGKWRWLARTDLGVTWAKDLLELPASKRFFAGGDNSVRGFDLDELGPTDDEGQVIGGRYLAVASLELERRLVGKWSAAVFIDAGNAYDPDYNSDLAYGAGLGVRWRSPVGPIRVDLAAGLSADKVEPRLHIVVGPEL